MLPPSRPVRLVLGLVISSLILTACTSAAAPATGAGGTQGQGGGGAGATSAASQGTSGGGGGGDVTIPDPCTLLTPDEIKAEFTFEVKQNEEPGSNAGAAAPDCNWQAIDFHPTFLGVQLSVQKFDQGFFDFMKGPKSVDAAGLGDAAYWMQATSPFTLQMKKGNLHFTFYVVASGWPDEAGQRKVINLANDVLGRL